MIKEIVRDIVLLSKKCEDATKDDLYIAQDLRDTLEASREDCVGMAANMIGYLKKIIVIDGGLVMFNPKIIKTFGEPYEAEEGCLSLDGARTAKRYRKIKVSWMDEDWKVRIKTFEGLEAQILQHEIDHCNGIVI